MKKSCLDSLQSKLQQRVTSISAVHGLGGNAFDTWMASTRMCLRGFLPNSSGFENARTMTFG